MSRIAIAPSSEQRSSTHNNPLGIFRQLFDWRGTNKKKQQSDKAAAAATSRPSATAIKPQPTTSHGSSLPIALDQPRALVPTPKKAAAVLFEEQYEILKHLGNGSYSQVKQVTHRTQGGTFAAKLVEKQVLSKTDRVALSQEVLILSRMDHPNVMRLHEVLEDDSKCIMIIECLDGGDLFDRVTQKGKLADAEAQGVMAALVEAVYYCHSHCILHRDIKPENILMSSSGIKLCDFGFAKQLNSVHERATDSCGTPGYAAPEVLNGRSYGFEVDIFSLGVVLYILLCGYPPFPMKLQKLRKHNFEVVFPPKEWNHVAYSTKELIKSMLAVDPALRPTALMLKQHPWILQGHRHRAVAASNDLHTQFTSGAGVSAIKYGRQGIPHATCISLCTTCHMVWWRPKDLDRTASIVHKLFSPRRSAMNSPHAAQWENAACHNHPSKGILVADIHQIVQGLKTPVFERSVSPRQHLVPERCCSIVTESRTLDLEFESKEVCDAIVALFTQVVTAQQPTTI
ncbi:CAMK protein kinase [Aphanomyces invadans]|uniref:non-specific serine/threonine protein kinase n=1 Tax=Aphanomyces invadans TaxID=157072 RepID=A0A024U3L7_9STRA|nr:CAMK protein kinase [Aphanomyces invadans]ETW00820.1 CAMK protein kinase [Aphanomyces invadans]|eukprot:XP_008870955.1 CAMK protein kinase [Aphanomyces invadans]